MSLWYSICDSAARGLGGQLGHDERVRAQRHRRSHCTRTSEKVGMPGKPKDSISVQGAWSFLASISTDNVDQSLISPRSSGGSGQRCFALPSEVACIFTFVSAKLLVVACPYTRLYLNVLGAEMYNLDVLWCCQWLVLEVRLAGGWRAS